MPGAVNLKSLLRRFEELSKSRLCVSNDEENEGRMDETGGADNEDNEEVLRLRKELAANHKAIIEEFKRLTSTEDTSGEITRLGQMFIKYGPEQLASEFLCLCVELIYQQRLKSNAVDELISTVGGASHSTLSKLFDKLQALIEAKADEDSWFRCLELLPIIIPLLSKSSRPDDPEAVEEDFQDFKSLIADILKGVDFKKPICIPILSIVGELNLPVDSVDEILNKALEMSSNIQPNDMPMFCYYALLASRRGSAVGFSQVFSQLLTSLTQFEEGHRNFAKVKPVIGTVLLHLTLAVRQDPNLLKEVLRFAKNPPLRILHSVFFASFLLALSATPPYSDSIYPCLRNQILRHLKFADRCTQAHWLDKLSDAVGGILPVTEVLLLAAKQSYTDAVAESAVQFAFFMLDNLTGGMALSTVTTNACHHAVTLITLAFHSSETAQEPILGHLFERLLSSGSATPVRGRFLLDIVRQLVLKGPHFLMGHSAKLRQLIDYLPSFPLATAEDLIKTLMLLFRINVSLRDALLLLLRKLLFSRKIEHRLLAAKGYIQFLLNFKVVGGLASTQSQNSFSASQAASSLTTGRKASGDRLVNPANKTGNDALCLEILGILKRCLEQQVEVRRAIYAALPEVLHKNSQLVDPVMQLLANHLREYIAIRDQTVTNYDEDDAGAEKACPIMFAKCLKSGQLVEPFADLIHCINRCLAESKRLDDGEPEICGEMRSRLSHLFELLMTTDVAELLPDKAEPDVDAPRCRLIICTLAAMMEIGYGDVFHNQQRDYELNLTGVMATQDMSSRLRRVVHVLACWNKMIRIFDALPTQSTLLGGKKTGKPGKPAAAAKKDGGKKAGGANSSMWTKMTSIMTLLSKGGSATHFIDLAFVTRFVQAQLNAAAGGDGVERRTTTETNSQTLMPLMYFLMVSASKCQLKDNRRLAESSFSLARLALDSIKGLYDGLHDPDKFFSTGAYEYLQSVFSQAVQSAQACATVFSLPGQVNAAAALPSAKPALPLRELLTTLDDDLGGEGESDEELRVAFLGIFFGILRDKLNDAANDANQTVTTAGANAKDAHAAKEFTTLLSVIKALGLQFPDSDGAGVASPEKWKNAKRQGSRDDDVGNRSNRSSSERKVDELVKKLCKECVIPSGTSCRLAFDFMLESAYRTDNRHHHLLKEVTEDVSKKLGLPDQIELEEDDDESSNTSRFTGSGLLKCLNNTNVQSCAVSPLLHNIEHLLADANFVLELTRLWLMVPDDLPNANLNPANPGQRIPRIRDNFWTAVFQHQIAMVQASKNILQSHLSAPMLLSSLKTLTRVYDSLWRSTRMVQSALASYAKDRASGWLPNGFEHLVRATGADFQSIIYEAMSRFMKLNEEAVKKKAKAARDRKNKKNKKKKDEDEDDDEDQEQDQEEDAGRSITPKTAVGGSALEARLLPSLIFAIEQYEQMVLRLSKRKGLHNLGANMKRSTARDFRLRLEVIPGQEPAAPPKTAKSPSKSQQKSQKSQKVNKQKSPPKTSRKRKTPTPEPDDESEDVPELEEVDEDEENSTRSGEWDDSNAASSDQDSYRRKVGPPTTGKKRRILSKQEPESMEV